MNIQEDQIIGELVAQDFRAATVFKKYGIDFCCQGNKTINDACEKKSIDIQSVLNDLAAAAQTNGRNITDFQSWPLGLLADYIVQKHHRYVEERSLEIKPYLEKLCRVHGGRHPELFKITEHFVAGTGVLAQHMKKEELVLFPFIHKMERAKKEGVKIDAPHFGTIKNPIKMMMDEHAIEGDRFKNIKDLSKGYTPPQDACNTYRVTIAMLKEFEEDLHMHVHLENNILFPKAIELEEELIKK